MRNQLGLLRSGEMKGENRKKTKSLPNRSRRSFPALLGLLGLLVLAAWLGDLPGLWSRFFADRALKNVQPHRALAWLAADLNSDTSDLNSRLLAVRAYAQLNLNSQASQMLDLATQMGLEGPREKVFRDMIAAQQGDLIAAEQLMSGNVHSDIPSEAYEAVLRCAAYHSRFDWVDVMLEQLDAMGKQGNVVSPAIVEYQRGRKHEIQEEFNVAAQHYLAALREQPRMARAGFRAAFCKFEVHEFEQALALFSSIDNDAYIPIARIEQANCFWELNELERAQKMIESPLASPPGQLIELYLQLDEYVDADRAALVAARIEDGLGNAERAIGLLERVLQFNNRNFEARSLLIKNLRVLGRQEEAAAIAKIQTQMIQNRERCRHLRSEIERNPGDLDKRCELAELYWYTESEAEARLALAEILDLDPNCVRAKELLSRFDAENLETSGPVTYGSEM